MEDAGRLRSTHTWERVRKIGLKEWEQESQREREEVWNWEISLSAAAAQHPTMRG